MSLDSKWRAIRDELKDCKDCKAEGLLGEDAKPLFTKEPPARYDVLFVMKCPNGPDTTKHDYLTICEGKDRTDQMFTALYESCFGLCRQDSLPFVTNAVLCVPRQKADSYPVTGAQIKKCNGHLKTLIDQMCPGIVCALGGEALKAVSRIDRMPSVKVGEVVGQTFKWYGRKLVPLYHPAARGKEGSFLQQKNDWKLLAQEVQNLR